ncbi:MAG TPA: hypothetical protein VGJ05_06905 [Fimbriiglobus sp.]
MVTRRNLAIILVSSLLALGAYTWWCSDRPTLPTDADQLILYSIDGNFYELGKEPKVDEYFHKYPVLGKIDVEDPAVRKEILDSLADGIAKGGPAFRCFIPRHAIRTVKNGITVDIAICFECGQYRVFGGENFNTKSINSSPQAILNHHLTAAGIPLAPGMKAD